MVEGTRKPPIGIQPKLVWLYQRQEDLAAAIQRYAAANEPVPERWIEEMSWLAVHIDAAIRQRGVGRARD